MDVCWTPFYEDVQIFLSTPFETLPDQKIPGATGRTNLKIFPSGGGVHIHLPEIQNTYPVLSKELQKNYQELSGKPAE